MAWQDRDYAKWTDEERNRFVEAGAVAAPGRRLLRPGAGVAIAVSGVLALAFGHFHLGRPLTAAGPSPVTRTISGPGTATLGGTLTLSGAAPAGDGAVTVEGSYDGGQTWQTLSSVQSRNGTYATSVGLSRLGVLHLRILFADGSTAVGSVVVVGGSAPPVQSEAS